MSSPTRTGVVVKSTEEYLATPPTAGAKAGHGGGGGGPTYTTLDSDDDIQIQDEEDEPPEPVKILDELSGFDEVVVWGHDHLPAMDDPFVKGVEEWIAFAEALHGGQVRITAQESPVVGGNASVEFVGEEGA